LQDADVFTDFRVGEDLIGLTNGLRFEDLNISPGSGNQTIIQDMQTGEFLVIFEGVNSTQLSAANFRTVPGQFTIWV